jgi:UDP-2-acetamido-2-deoxy-ribo-hexuluronate aminotransferase
MTEPQRKIPFIDLQAQYRRYQQEIGCAIQSVLDSSQYVLGKDVSDLEQELTAFTGASHCIGCSSGTDALLLALMAIGVKAGDEVITTPFTFIATAEMIALLGAIPVYADIDERTYNIDAALIEAKITSRTKAIIPVSLYGQPADFDEINQLAAKHGLVVIEDAAQSFGAEYKGKKSGNLSTIACTSFFPSKPLGCYGDGGAVFTGDDAIAGRLRSLMNHGQSERYRHAHVGINGRLDTIQAAVLRVKLKYFGQEIRERSIVAKRYNRLLEATGLVTPTIRGDRTSVFAQYSVRSTKRERLVAHLNGQGVPTAIHYPIPLYRQEALRDSSCTPQMYPVTEEVTREIMSLPMSAFLTEEQQYHIVGVIREF